MKRTLVRRIAAGFAIAFSLLTLVEGSQVVLGITQPAYIVLMPLLIYNVIMAIVGLVAGVALWSNHRWMFTLATTIGTVHVIVLLIVGAMFLFGAEVAMHSVGAMGIRSAIWMLIVWVVWKIKEPESINVCIEPISKSRHEL